jgi:hypothetical protein
MPNIGPVPPKHDLQSVLQRAFRGRPFSVRYDRPFGVFVVEHNGVLFRIDERDVVACRGVREVEALAEHAARSLVDTALNHDRGYRRTGDFERSSSAMRAAFAEALEEENARLTQQNRSLRDQQEILRVTRGNVREAMQATIPGEFVIQRKAEPPPKPAAFGAQRPKPRIVMPKGDA